MIRNALKYKGLGTMRKGGTPGGKRYFVAGRVGFFRVFREGMASAAMASIVLLNVLMPGCSRPQGSQDGFPPVNSSFSADDDPVTTEATKGVTSEVSENTVADNSISQGNIPNAATKLFDGKSLEGWRIVEDHNFSEHGLVEVRDGAIQIGDGSPASGVSWTGPHPQVNYEFSCEAMRTDGGDFFCGLTFPVRDSYCTLIVGGWGGGVVGLSNVDDYPADSNETSKYIEVDNNRWYAIRLRVTGDHITAWIDGERVFNLPTKDRRFSIWWEQEPVKPLGIATWYTSAAIRKIELTEIATDTPTPETATTKPASTTDAAPNDVDAPTKTPSSP